MQSVIMQVGTLSPMGKHRMPGLVQGARVLDQANSDSIAELRKRHYSEIEPCKPKPMDQKFQLFCLATLHIR